jgi:hypothetical protein
MCTGISAATDLKVTAAKDRTCRSDEILLERSEKEQWLEDGAGSAGVVFVATCCEDSARLLVKDGPDCGGVAESVSESGLFPCGICGKRVNARQKCGCSGIQESTARNARSK